MTDHLHIVELISGYGFSFEEVAFAECIHVMEVERIYKNATTFLNVNDRINNVLVVKQSIINNDDIIENQ